MPPSHDVATPNPAALRRRLLRNWYRTYGRRFPWRLSDDPWLVFVSEFLLQRTRADTVASALSRFIEQFPDPRSVASASAGEVADAIRPLGLIRRAAQLVAACRIIEDTHNGRIPTDTASLLELPGIGPYVATAVAMNLTSHRGVLVDTNTVRVSLRVAGIQVDSTDVRRQRVATDAVYELLGVKAGRRVWWAVLDLAATVCRPREPRCLVCPLRSLCRTGAGTSAHAPS